MMKFLTTTIWRGCSKKNLSRKGFNMTTFTIGFSSRFAWKTHKFQTEFPLTVSPNDKTHLLACAIVTTIFHKISKSLLSLRKKRLKKKSKLHKSQKFEKGQFLTQKIKKNKANIRKKNPKKMIVDYSELIINFYILPFFHGKRK